MSDKPMIQNTFNWGHALGINVVVMLAGVVALRLGPTLLIPAIIALLMAAVLGPAAGLAAPRPQDALDLGLPDGHHRPDP